MGWNPNELPTVEQMAEEWGEDARVPYVDQPCPSCGRDEGAYEQGECAACGYRACLVQRRGHAHSSQDDLVCVGPGTNCPHEDRL